MHYVAGGVSVRMVFACVFPSSGDFGGNTTTANVVAQFFLNCYFFWNGFSPSCPGHHWRRS